MPVNRAVGNMYEFLNEEPWEGYTHNLIGGHCKHFCSYCFVKKGRCKFIPKYNQEPFLDVKELEVKYKDGWYIFICATNDITGSWIPSCWVLDITRHCKKYPNCKFLFQGKNPGMFKNYLAYLPSNCVLGTTIESNRAHNVSKAPIPHERMMQMCELSRKGYETMISIEPIMKFDLDVLVGWIQVINPSFVSIGADSKNCKLQEPTPEEVRALVTELRKITKVYLKNNLRRLFYGKL